MILPGHWKTVLVAIAVFAILGFIGNLQLTIARQGRQIGELQRELASTVKAVTQEDLDALAKSVDGSLTREIGTVKETLRLLESRQPGTRTVERIIERRGPPGPAGPTGSPGAPGKPGTPIIPPEQQPAARREAIEKVYLTFDDGHLLDCATPTLGNPNVVELLRAPTGGLFSTSPCLGRIADTFTLQEAKPLAPVPSRWKGLAAYRVSGGGWGLGVGYTLASVWKVDLDAVVLASLSQQFYLGPGASFRATVTISLGAAYTYGFTERTDILWTYAGVRW